ncbi:probable WRKY transcription factor 41 [Solanum dulcamara]|uniref:probable WRKY transcription factor 41 n=1 Tax=Solanum dulcamara TaxID=45834 RepID=UPI002485009F|nr:probable WRKY transcription factor 41 [Solanum dulcamara]
MEKVKGLEKKKLMNELTQGKEFVNQLKNQIGPLSSPEERDLLIGKILCTLEKSLSILNLKALLLEGGINNTNNSTASCSSMSFLGSKNNSPKSEVLDSSRDQFDKNIVSKKRKKAQPRINQTSICVNGLEDPREDGYSWRKYGQKDILGANHPRAYYRCTHRNTQGCLATKQVQKRDGDSTIFEVTYKGRHSCKVAQSDIFSLQNQKRQKHNKKQEEEMVIFNSAPNYKVENSNITTTKEEVFTPFPFPPTPLNLENIEETKFFFDDIAPFSSPIASELPSYFSMLTSQNEEFGMENMILQNSDSDLTELISTPTSISYSSFGGDGDLAVDFEPNVTFDITEFFT